MRTPLVLLKMIGLPTQLLLALCLTIAMSSVFAKFIHRGVHPWQQRQEKKRYNPEGPPESPSYGVAPGKRNQATQTPWSLMPTPASPAVHTTGQAAEAAPKQDTIGEDISQVHKESLHSRLSDDKYGTMHREKKCSKKKRSKCSGTAKGSVTYVNWLNAARSYKQCSSMKIPKSCRMVENELRCSLPLEGEAYPIIRLMTIHGLKFSIGLVDRGFYGMYFDILLAEKTIDDLIVLFKTKSIQELAANMTTYEQEITEMHRQYFENSMNKTAPMPDSKFTHPAESLYHFIARIKIFNPMETDEILLKTPPDPDDSDDGDIDISSDRAYRLVGDD